MVGRTGSGNLSNARLRRLLIRIVSRIHEIIRIVEGRECDLAKASVAPFENEAVNTPSGPTENDVIRVTSRKSTRAQAFEHTALTHWQGLIEVPLACAGLDVVSRLSQLDECSSVRRVTSARVDAAPLGR